jgi:two-component system response regulator PilR (NtrC family)
VIPPEGIDLARQVEAYESAFIAEALRQTNGNLTAAAKLLGLTFRAIRYKVKKYGIERRAPDAADAGP